MIDVNKILAVKKHPESFDPLPEQLNDAVSILRRFGLIEASEFVRERMIDKSIPKNDPISLNIRQNLNSSKCLCGGKMYIGAVSLENQAPAVFCMDCNTRVKITLELVEAGL